MMTVAVDTLAVIPRLASVTGEPALIVAVASDVDSDVAICASVSATRVRLTVQSTVSCAPVRV